MYNIDIITVVYITADISSFAASVSNMLCYGEAVLQFPFYVRSHQWTYIFVCVLTVKYTISEFLGSSATSDLWFPNRLDVANTSTTNMHIYYSYGMQIV